VTEIGPRRDHHPIFIKRSNAPLWVVSVRPARRSCSGLKVDVDALPQPLIERLKRGQVNLNDPATTHDGQFRTLLDAVNHYNTRFSLGLTAQEKSDLST